MAFKATSSYFNGKALKKSSGHELQLSYEENYFV
jgi:hypothetical protein